LNDLADFLLKAVGNLQHRFAAIYLGSLLQPGLFGRELPIFEKLLLKDR
jgi:hypothetical protein